MGYIAKIIFKIHTLAKGLFFGLMVTTAWMAYRVCESALGGSIMLPPVWESVLVVGAALVITYLIDNALYENSVAALAQAIEQGGFWKIYKKGGFATLILFALMAGRFFFSGGATYLTGESTVVGKQAESDALEKIQSFEEDKTQALARIESTYKAEADKAIERSEREAAQIKADAEQLARRTVETAIKQGSPAEQRDYANKDWIRAEYSLEIKAAEKKAYDIEAAAAKEAKAVIKAGKDSKAKILAAMQEKLYQERNNPKWQHIKKELDTQIWAENTLYTAERWTYYLLDFILVVGGFFCSWLVAFHIVHSDDTMETFFPDKPGITDVFGDMVGSIYTYFVTMVAQVPAYFKEEGSKRMVRVAKSVGKSSSAYNAAIAEYLVASHPTVNAQVGLVAHQTAMQKAQQRAQQAQQAQQRAQQENEAAQIRMRQEAQQARQQYSSSASTMSSVDTYQASTYSASPQNDDSATGATEGATNATDSETGETQPKRKQSGAAFRSYLSRAGQAFAAGDDEIALELLDVAKQVLPDDSNKTKRLEKLNELKKAIQNG
jgi:hypothetical protein